MNFKEILEDDIKNTFHDTEEFGEVREVRYNGNYYNIPVVIDSDIMDERQKPSSDHAGGIFVSDMRVYIAFSDLKVIPRKNQKIEIDGDMYNIVKVANEMGEIILDLEMYDE